MFNKIIVQHFLLIALCSVCALQIKAQETSRFQWFPDTMKQFGLTIGWEPLLLQARVHTGAELPASYARLDLLIFERLRLRGLYGQAAAPEKLHPIIQGNWGHVYGFGLDMAMFPIFGVTEMHFSFEQRNLRASYSTEVFVRDPSNRDLYVAQESAGDVRMNEFAFGLGIRGQVWRNIGISFVPIEACFVERGVFTDTNLFDRQNLGLFGPNLLERNVMHPELSFKSQLTVFVHLVAWNPDLHLSRRR